MFDAARHTIAQAMKNAQDPQPFSAYAPSNIALSKYWGKRDRARNLPLNSSLSVSLADWGALTDVAPSPDGQDRVILNGETQPETSAFARKALKFVDMFRDGRDWPLLITTKNTVPTAAGLASSASGFAALTRAVCGSFNLDLPDRDMSLIARLGSGSATRSFWHGFVRWNRGFADDGHDSFAEPLALDWPDFRIAIVKVNTGPKEQSSRDGMNHTVETSPLFAAWPDLAEADCAQVEQALVDQDFVALGARVEANALTMHATMQAARPALTYLTSQSWAVLETLWQARKEGLQAYATMDAGANVKLIFLRDSADDVAALFPRADIITPFPHDK